MSKVSGVIGILNLLESRACVSLKDMVTHCRISERTAYRYVRALEVGGMPIVFDRKLRAYQLKRAERFPIGELRLDQAILIGLALQLLAVALNEPQRGILRETWQRIVERQTQLSREAGEVIQRAIAGVGELPSMAHTANAIVIQLAAIHRRPILVSCARENEKPRSHKVRQPSLRFQDAWYLRDLSRPEAGEHRLEDILSVRME